MAERPLKELTEEDILSVIEAFTTFLMLVDDLLKASLVIKDD